MGVRVRRRGGKEGKGPEGEKVEGNVWSAASMNVGCGDGGREPALADYYTPHNRHRCH